MKELLEQLARARGATAEPKKQDEVQRDPNKPVTLASVMEELDATAPSDRYLPPDPLARDPLKRRDWREIRDSQAAFNVAKADGTYDAALARINQLEAERISGLQAQAESERQARNAVRQQKKDAEAAAKQAAKDAAVDAQNEKIAAARDGFY